MENCFTDGQGVRLRHGDQKGIFFSRVMDSREKGNEWHRMTCSLLVQGAEVRIRIYSSDSRQIPFNGGMADVEVLIKDGRISAEEKEKILRPFFRKELINRTDVLLHGIRGQYAWFEAGLDAGQERGAGVGNLFFYFPKDTWMGYLPGVYGRDKDSAAFLERYLGVFQSFYEEMDKKISDGNMILDPEATPGEYVYWLAGWLDIGQTYLWGEERLRKLIQKGPGFFKKRGTRQGLLELIELYTGETPYIVEAWQLRPYFEGGGDRGFLDRLYGSDDNSFVLLVKERYIKGARDRDALLSLVEEAVPAHMEVRLVALKPFIFLGEYSYLGINSRLGYYRAMQLDGLSQLPFTSIGKDSERRRDRI